MAIENSTTPTQLEMLRCILEEIASNANLNNHQFDIDENDYTLSLVMQRIGYLADLGITKIDGAPAVIGDADDWFLGPIYREQKRAIPKEAAQ